MIPPAVLLAQYTGTLDFSETSRLDARSTQPFAITPAPPPRDIAIASDASIALSARLRLNNRRWEWLFAYTPSIAVTDIELTPYAQPVWMNAGSAMVAWHDRIVRIAVSEFASYGEENLGYVYGTPIAGQSLGTSSTQTGSTQTGSTQTGSTQTGSTQTGSTPTTGGTAGATTAVGQNGASAGGQLVPTFPYGSSFTSATVTVRASRTVTVNVTGGYSLSGNLTDSEQVNVVYPEQYGPVGSAAVTYAASRADSWITTASGQDTTTPKGVCVLPMTGTFCRLEVPVLTVQETLRHRLSPTASIGASLGASASTYQLTTGNDWGILPVAGVNYTDALGPLSTLRLSADLAPTINVFTGTPSTRLQLSATLVERLSPTVTLNVTASGLQTVSVPHPDPAPLTFAGAGVDLRVRITRLVTGSVGIQGFWQEAQNVGAWTTTASEVGYVALLVRLPTLRL